jgi:hypothetical protein
MIKNGVDPARLAAVRRHYKKHHPRQWKKIVRKAVRTRMERRRRLKAKRLR